MNYFKNVDDFYKNFYKNLDKNLENFFNIKKKIINDNKIKFPHYSISDIKFRLVRDVFLTKVQYEDTMFSMFKEKQFNHNEYSKKLFLLTFSTISPITSVLADL